MKRIALILAILICFTSLPAYADGAQSKTYNTSLTIADDGTVTAGGSDVITVDSVLYELVGEGTFADQTNLVLTKPGFAIAHIAFINDNQRPTEIIPVPVSLDYECVLTQQRYESDGVTKVDEFLAKDVTGWLNSGPPQFVKPGSGDFEWAYIEVTQDMIDAAGGSFEVVFLVRGKLYPETPISDLGQLYSNDYIHVYQQKDFIGNQDVIGNFVGSSKPETVYQVEIYWGSMEFSYTESDTGTWNPSTHSYVGGGKTGVWSVEDNSNSIAVYNRSNSDVNISLTYNAKDIYSDIITEFTFADGSAVNSFTLEGADATGYITNNQCFLKVVDGKLSEDDLSVTIGTVCLTLE